MRKLLALLFRSDGRRGYNLLEVLIGMTILAIALASAFAMSVANARLVENNQNLSAAVSLAESKLEELRNTTFDAIVDGSDSYKLNAKGEFDGTGIFNRAWTVASGAPGFANGDLKTVVVVVSWAQWGNTRSYSLTGVIGR
ncbi:prepilin-type N-terminal cleavage/methylation domain-containing protein [bacterium]|nr:prepilin-type N-terminal cleavage/methylation domain-containing protein [bacterium]